MRLDRIDDQLLSGVYGQGAQLAMQLLYDLGMASGAEEFIDIESAHVDGCFYVGQTSVDFIRMLAEGGAMVRVPTTLNVGSVDLLRRDLRPLVGAGEDAAELMAWYARIGCDPTWTCTPYQGHQNPARGSHVAWGESSAIVFANSVLGARTERYGDFVDVAAAITGRVPLTGLHLEQNRLATLEFEAGSISSTWLGNDVLWSLLGLHVGARATGEVPVISGLPPGATRDQLKAFGSAAASSGSVALFHVVGSTPEAQTREEAVHGSSVETVHVSDDDLEAAWCRLTSTITKPLTHVCLGTPHFSLAEFAQLTEVLGGRPVHSDIQMVVSTSRSTLEDLTRTGLNDDLGSAGVRIVVDTCTYNSRVLGDVAGSVLTNSAKWAYYAPMNLDVEAAFAGLSTCVEAAVSGRWPDHAV